MTMYIWLCTYLFKNEFIPFKKFCVLMNKTEEYITSVNVKIFYELLLIKFSAALWICAQHQTCRIISLLFDYSLEIHHENLENLFAAKNLDQWFKCYHDLYAIMIYLKNTNRKKQNTLSVKYYKNEIVFFFLNKEKCGIYLITIFMQDHYQNCLLKIQNRLKLTNVCTHYIFHYFLDIY